MRFESNFHLILTPKRCTVFSLLFLYVSDDKSTIKLLWGILLTHKLLWTTSVAFLISGVLDRLSGLLTFHNQGFKKLENHPVLKLMFGGGEGNGQMYTDRDCPGGDKACRVGHDCQQMCRKLHKIFINFWNNITYKYHILFFCK